MRKRSTFLPALALGVAGAISVATPSLADPITYTEQATASGSLNGVCVDHTTRRVLTLSNDTTNVIGRRTDDPLRQFSEQRP